MANKVVFIKAHFRPMYGKVGLLKTMFGSTEAGTYNEKPEGHEIKGWSKSQIDGERLASDISTKIAELNKSGYEIISISNLNSGNFTSDYSSAEKSSYGWGYGYSYSEGVLILAKKIS